MGFKKVTATIAWVSVATGILGLCVWFAIWAWRGALSAMGVL